MTTSLEIYADVWCPFAHVGLRAARELRATLGREDVSFVVRSWPLELVNGRALDSATTADHVRELREQVAPEMFRGFNVANFPVTTLPALALAERGYRRDPSVGEAVSVALRDALFEEGRDVGREDVLTEIARSHGLDDLGDPDDVIASWREGVERSVQGSPHFFCQGRAAFCPTLDISRSETGGLDVRRRSQTLEEFLRHCFTESPGASVISSR